MGIKFSPVIVYDCHELHKPTLVDPHLSITMFLAFVLHREADADTMPSGSSDTARPWQFKLLRSLSLELSVSRNITMLRAQARREKYEAMTQNPNCIRVRKRRYENKTQKEMHMIARTVYHVCSAARRSAICSGHCSGENVRCWLGRSPYLRLRVTRCLYCHNVSE